MTKNPVATAIVSASDWIATSLSSILMGSLTWAKSCRVIATQSSRSLTRNVSAAGESGEILAETGREPVVSARVHSQVVVEQLAQRRVVSGLGPGILMWHGVIRPEARTHRHWPFVNPFSVLVAIPTAPATLPFAGRPRETCQIMTPAVTIRPTTGPSGLNGVPT